MTAFMVADSGCSLVAVRLGLGCLLHGNAGMAIKLLVVDDHPVVRHGVRAMLAGSDLHVVAEAADGVEALHVLDRVQVDLVLLDLKMPQSDGLKCLAELRSRRPSLPVLLFSGQENPTTLARGMALQAAGFVTKTASRDALQQAIRQAATGQSVWSREHLRKANRAPNRLSDAAGLDVLLTKREAEVLAQLALGLTNKEIAQTLGISYETVKEHVQHILKKIGVSDRTQAAVWAVKLGIA